LLYTGERDHYAGVCRDMLKRFADHPKVEYGERAAKLCLIGVHEAGDPKVLAALVDRALADEKAKKLFAHFRLSHGFAEYRAGDWQAAADTLQKALGPFRGTNPFHAQGLLFLAMARKRLNKDDEARKHLAEADRILDRLESGGRMLSTDSWHDALFPLALRREAEKLVQGP
jgi:hypothetical protein